MANTIDEAGKKVKVSLVEFSGEKIMLPENMRIKEAIKILEAREAYLEQPMQISEEYNVFPPDGANALNACIAARYGWTQSVPTPGFWGDKPPQLIRVQTGISSFVEVPWGALSCPVWKGIWRRALAKSVVAWGSESRQRSSAKTRRPSG